MAAVFAGASAELTRSSDFAELAAQHATPGGQNERLVARLKAAGMFGLLTDGLDALLVD